MQKLWIRCLIALTMVLGSQFAMAQLTQDNDIFSRFGMGTLIPQDFASISGTGLSAANSSYHHLNPSNPASYGSLGLTSFEVGTFYQFTRYTSDTTKLNVHNGNLSYLALGFPVFNPLNQIDVTEKRPWYWGMSFGLIPYSRVDYNVLTTENIDNIGEVRFSKQGRGGQYQFYWGNGFKFKDLSVGFQIGHLFGKTSYEQFVYLDDIEYDFEDWVTEQINFSGMTHRIGVQYDLVLNKLEDEEEERKRKNKTHLKIGVSGNAPTKVRVFDEKNIIRFNVNEYNIIDSVITVDRVKDKATLPMQINSGFIIEKDNHWSFGLNHTYTGWDNFVNPFKSDNLRASSRFAAGVEIIPDYDAFKKYFRQIEYRFGAFYESDPRLLNGESFNNFGISFGLGLPMRSSRRVPSFVNLAFEYGHKGTADLINANYFRATLGFTLNDNSWFYKQKFK